MRGERYAGSLAFCPRKTVAYAAMNSAKLHFPATQRNREAIGKVMCEWVQKQHSVDPSGYRVLEVAAGSGEHSISLAPELAKLQPNLRWQSSDLKAEHIASIRAWQEESGEALYDPAIALDVLDSPGPQSPAPGSVDLLYNANMIHIAPWECTAGLFRLAERALSARGMIFLYGPFMRNGAHTSQSNAAFSEGLRDQDPRWGVRELEAVQQVASSFAFSQVDLREMPANNLSILFKRV